jgi:nucleoside-diphosphate-sugar epimerase
VIGKWEKCIEEQKPLTIYGNGNKRRDFTHIDDIVSALILINEKQAWGHMFELGRGKNYSIKEIASMFQTDIIYEADKPGEADITLCTDAVAKEVLGWEAKLDISDYINNYLA